MPVRTLFIHCIQRTIICFIGYKKAQSSYLLFKPSCSSNTLSLVFTSITPYQLRMVWHGKCNHGTASSGLEEVSSLPSNSSYCTLATRTLHNPLSPLVRVANTYFCCSHAPSLSPHTLLTIYSPMTNMVLS